MKHHRIFIFFISLFCIFSLDSFSEDFDVPPPHSQIRGADESYDQAHSRYLRWLEIIGQRLPPTARTALNAAVPLHRVDWSKAQSWDELGPDFENVRNAFMRARDERFLIVPEQPHFPRRPSWLYPDDGCFARAAMTSGKLDSWNYPRPSKLFAFGSLSVRTPNSPSGVVYWWYHVVPVLSHANQAYVFDAAVEPRTPLPVLEWIKKMVPNPSKVKVSLCNPYAYEPNSLCEDSVPNTERYAVQHQIRYLRQEWSRVRSLGRSPEKELGENPPWRDDIVNFL